MDPSENRVIELHGARVKQISIKSGGSCTIELDQLSAYCKTSDPDRFDVRTHRAEMSFRGVRQAELRGDILKDDMVVEGIAKRAGVLWHLLSTGGWLGVEEVEMHFSGGAFLRIESSGLYCELHEEGELLETRKAPATFLSLPPGA